MPLFHRQHVEARLRSENRILGALIAPVDRVADAGVLKERSQPAESSRALYGRPIECEQAAALVNSIDDGVTLAFVSWNLIGNWLQQLELLRRVASFTA
jgi:hypothetical protein